MKKFATFVLLLGVVLFMTTLPVFAQTDDELFGGSSTSTDDDALFGGSSTITDDDALFGGDNEFIDDDALFGGSSSVNDDDALFGVDSTDDDMFGGDSMIQDITAPSSDVAQSSVSATALGVIFEAGSVRFGGSLDTSLQASAHWDDPYNSNNLTWKYLGDGFYNATLIPKIGSTLFFDARPKESLRLYGKFKIDYPFEVNVVSLKIPSFSVFEMFTDFNWKDTAFFRFGKHSVNWGVGYFFSPADIINLSSIDPEHPDVQREGPISLRSQIIFPGTQNCLWLYALPDVSNTEKARLARYTAFAGKYEFLIGNYELGIGGWYKYERSPRLCMTVTGSIKKLSIFAEGVLAYGTENQWKKGDSLPFKAMWPICQATIGGSYSWKVPKISVSAQYFYNGFGELNVSNLSVDEYLSLKSVYGYTGQNYAALSVSKSELFTKKLSISAFTLMGFNSFSGMASGTLSLSLFDGCSMSFGPSFTFGKNGGEFTRVTNDPDALGVPGPETISCTLSISMGGGKF